MDIPWRKSSFSDHPDGACLELALLRGTTLIRESDEPDVVIEVSSGRLGALLTSVKAGAFSAAD